jgi:hypothetical protein
MSASVGLKDKIAGDDHTDGEAWPNGERRLDRELTPDDLLAGVVDRVLGAALDGLDEFVLIVGGELGSDAEQRRETHRLGKTLTRCHSSTINPDQPRLAIRR